MGRREDYINAMKSFDGAKDGNALHHKIVDIYNKFVSEGKSPGSKYIVKYTDAWCAATVSAAAIVSNNTDIIPVECSCTRQINLFRKMGRYEENEKTVPVLGSLVYYNWSERTKPEDVANHVGVVIYVNEAGQKFTVQEGNFNGKCQIRTIPFGWKYIHGFAIPDYGEEAPIAKENIYTVVKGDNLSKIAANLRKKGINTTWQKLAEINGIDYPYTIRPGQQLKY